MAADDAIRLILCFMFLLFFIRLSPTKLKETSGKNKRKKDVFFGVDIF